MDNRLRLRERHARSGDLDDQASVLVEWLRAGMLTREQVLVGAAAGIPVANQVLGLNEADARRECDRFLPAPSNDMFTPIVEQVSVVWELNQRLGWGFTAEDFVSLAIPTTWPTDTPHQLTAVTLVAYQATVGETFEALWKAIQARYNNPFRASVLKSDAKHLKLLDGIVHPGNCLRWETIDLAANWDQENGVAPRDVRDPANSPHAGILAAGAIHKRWVESMDGTTVPYVWVSGYQSREDKGEWWLVPGLGFYRRDRQAGLGRDGDDDRFQSFAIPSCRE